MDVVVFLFVIGGALLGLLLLFNLLLSLFEFASLLLASYLSDRERKEMEVTFEGIPSGDYECFTWAVDRETYVRVTGKEPDELDRNRFLEEELYDLYPSQAMKLFNEKRKLKFILRVEEDVAEEEGSA